MALRSSTPNDNLDRVVLEKNDTTTYEYFYDSEGNLAKKVDKTTGKAVNYQYDSLGRLIHSYQSDGSTIVQQTEHIYDTSNRISSQSWQLGDTTYSESYAYDADDGSLSSMTPAVGPDVLFAYDALKRLSTKTTGVVTQSYTYRNIDSSQTTTQVSRIGYTAANGSNVSDFSIYYTYDDLGNVASVSSSARTVLNASYVYDQQGQLIQETNNNGTMYYTYDTYGNIRSVSGDSSHTYTYDTGDWLDLLVKYDGVSITYDAIGNPLKYYNGTGWDFTWQNGRQMATATKRNTTASNSLSLSFTYDVAGIRDSKTVTTPSGTVTYNYLTQNGNVVQQTWTENGTKHTIDFIYDNAGSPYAFVYDGTIYYYVLNLQGDVILILNSSGGTVARYAYDAWGKIIYASGSMAEINPLRYRGYYYDTETKLYYLQSRYYDPLVKRFVNADGYVSTGQGFVGYNMFAYCNNNPTMSLDACGTFAISITTLILAGSALVGAACAGYTAYKEYKAGYSAGDIAFDSIGMGLGGFLTVYTLGMSTYQVYLNYCALNAITPVTEVGTKSTQSAPTYSVYGTSQAPKTQEPGSVYYKLDGQDGYTVTSVTEYNSHGKPAYRVDLYVGSTPHTHYIKSIGSTAYNHVHYYYYNSNGQRIGDRVAELF